MVYGRGVAAEAIRIRYCRDAGSSEGDEEFCLSASMTFNAERSRRDRLLAWLLVLDFAWLPVEVDSESQCIESALPKSRVTSTCRKPFFQVIPTRRSVLTPLPGRFPTVATTTTACRPGDGVLRASTSDWTSPLGPTDADDRCPRLPCLLLVTCCNEFNTVQSNAMNAPLEAASNAQHTTRTRATRDWRRRFANSSVAYLQPTRQPKAATSPWFVHSHWF